MNKNDEKRRAPRIESSGHGKVRSSVAMRVLDVSTVGLQMEVSAALRPGSIYELDADIDGLPLAARVRITRCRAGSYAADGKGGRVLLFRAGAEFIEVKGEVFRDWMERRTQDVRGQLAEPA